MADRLKFWLLFLVLALLAAAAFALVVWLAAQRPEGLALYATAVAIVFVGLLALAWAVLDIYLAAPLAAFVRSIELMLHANSGYRIEELPPFLSRLGQGINELGHELQAARTDLLQAAAAAAARGESDRARLEAILIDLNEGVLVCSGEGRILLYNQSAARLLGPAGEIGLGRSLYRLLSREAVEHTRNQLQKRLPAAPPSGRPEVSAPFVCGSLQGGQLLEGRLSLVPSDAGPEGANLDSGGFVLSLTDVTDEIGRQGQLDEVLSAATEGLRRPLANLRAAAESMADFPQMPTAQRHAFERVILEEGADMSERLEAASRRFEALARRPWPLSEVHSPDLLDGVIHMLAEHGGPTATMVGAPQWLHADSHALMLAMEFLLRHIQESRACDAFDLEATAEGGQCFLDIVWRGETLSAGEIEDWMERRLEPVPGSPTLGDTLARNGAREIWSEARGRGRAALRLPAIAASQDGTGAEPAEPLPERPEFYDFELLHRPLHDAERSRTLRSLIYVVFDTETTGLKPSQGDEIVSIAGVRVVNGRLITAETFERLVNPGRPIPAASMRFHGIGDDMVADSPPLSVVLPQFHAFAQDAVLVAHNAAFDLKFLQLKEASAGVSFANPVLDTLLLSAYLHRQVPDHSLDAIADRLGVTVHDRHTALGDAIATAQIFVRLLDLLEAAGVTTLAQAIEAGDSIVEIRRMQREF